MVDLSGAEQVAAMLFPESGLACGAASHDYTACPISDTLKVRLRVGPVPYVEQLTRSGEAYTARRFMATQTMDGAIVGVELTLPDSIQRLDLVLQRGGDTWLLADITCAGRGTSTSLFSSNPTQCFAVR